MNVHSVGEGQLYLKMGCELIDAYYLLVISISHLNDYNLKMNRLKKTQWFKYWVYWNHND